MENLLLIIKNKEEKEERKRKQTEKALLPFRACSSYSLMLLEIYQKNGTNRSLTSKEQEHLHPE